MTIESPATARSFPPGENFTVLIGVVSPELEVSNGRLAVRNHFTVKTVVHLVGVCVEDKDITVLMSRSNQVSVGRLYIC